MPQSVFRQRPDSGASAGWRFADPVYSDIKKLIGLRYSPLPDKPLDFSISCRPGPVTMLARLR